MSITRRSKGARHVPDLWQVPRAALLVVFGPSLAAPDHDGPSEIILTFDLTTI